MWLDLTITLISYDDDQEPYVADKSGTSKYIIFVILGCDLNAHNDIKEVF